MDIKKIAQGFSDHMICLQIEHYKAQQKTSSKWVAVLTKEQKKRKKAQDGIS